MNNKYKLSDQAVGALMLALNQAMLNVALNKTPEECDVVSMIKNFELEDSSSGLMVMNPPTLELDDSMFKKEKK